MSLVLWSGGCDSTLILDRLLANSSELNPVRALTIIHDQIYPKKQPALARKKAKAYWKKKGFHLDHVEFNVTRTGNIQANQSGGLSQPMFWLSFSIPYLLEEEDLYLGYVREDCIWHYKKELYGVFENWRKMSRRIGELRTPFEWTHKSAVISVLKDVDDLYKRTWWCEQVSNSKEPCGECTPCETHRTAQWQIEQGMDKGRILPSVFYD